MNRETPCKNERQKMNHVLNDQQISDFMQLLRQEEKSKATMGKYEHDIRKFHQYVQKQKITKDLVIAYKQELIQSYAAVSVNSMLIPVNRFLRFLGLYDCTVKTLKIQRASFRSREKDLSKAEYLRLLEAAEKMGDLRISLILQTIASTGIRISELPFITVKAVQDGFATVTLKGKTRKVLIPKDLGRKLKKYAAERGLSTGSIFVTRTGKAINRGNILRMMKRLCASAKVNPKKVFPHNFRHLFACQYYKVTRDIVRLADVLGHSSINTTRLYTVVSMEEQDRQINRLGLVI